MRLEKGRITILFERQGMRIELIDNQSSIMFAEIYLTSEEVTTAFSRIAYTPCLIKLYGLEKIGKKMEHKSFEFEIPDVFMKLKENALQTIKKVCPPGWIPDKEFNSQGSFFRKDEKQFARCIIRRWI